MTLKIENAPVRGGFYIEVDGMRGAKIYAEGLEELTAAITHHFSLPDHRAWSEAGKCPLCREVVLA